MKKKNKSILAVFIAVMVIVTLWGNPEGKVVQAEEEPVETYTCSLTRGAYDSEGKMVESDVYCMDRTLDEPEPENVYTRIRLSELDGYTKTISYNETEIPLPENMKIRFLKVLAGKDEIVEFLKTWNNADNILEEVKKEGGFSQQYKEYYQEMKEAGKTTYETVDDFFKSKIDSLEKPGMSHLVWLAAVQDCDSFEEAVLKFEDGRYYKRLLALYGYPYTSQNDIPEVVPEEVIYNDPMSVWNVYLKRIVRYIDEEIPDYYSQGYDAYVYQSDSKNTQHVIGKAFFDAVFVTKTDTDGKTLSGATLQILDKEGTVVEEWLSEDGSHMIRGLEKNTEYTLHETVAPEGYTVASDTTFTIDDAGKVTSTGTVTEDGILLVEDEIVRMQFKKEGTYREGFMAAADETVPLEGAVFGIYKDEIPDELVATATSDAEGIVSFEKIEKGLYQVREISAPEGYVPDENIWYARITDHGFDGLTAEPDGEKKLQKIVNHCAQGTIEIEKVNESHPENKLEGSTYGIFRSVDSYRKQAEELGAEEPGELPESLEKEMIDGEQYVLLKTAVTDKDGKVSFDGVLTGVTYVVKELEAPDGYYLSKNPIKVRLSVNGETGRTELDIQDVDDGEGTIRVVDDKITWLEPEVLTTVSKVDESGDPVVGAKLHIEDEDGTVIVSWATENEPKILEAYLKAGQSYRLVEDSAPEGYKIAGSISFTVSEKMGPDENAAIDLTMIDEKIPDDETEETVDDKSEKDDNETAETVDDKSEKDDNETAETVDIISEKQRDDSAPKTGDDFQMGVIGIVMIISAAGILYLLRKKTHIKDKD